MSKLVNAVIAQLTQGKRAIPFSFTNKATIQANGSNTVVTVNPTKADFLVTDVKISGYTVEGSLIGTNQALRDLFTIQIKNDASGENQFSGGQDVSNFVSSLNCNSRINPFLIGKGTKYEIEIKHENISSLYAMPITFSIVVDGIYLV